jgi:transcriptional regulator with XRE-family HTH domain
MGVTPQAISRWESGGGYPDLELLPLLADFFRVSTDELLGYKMSEREQELASMKKEMDRIAEVGSVEEQVAYARSAYARYPNDYEIRCYLGVSLYLLWEEKQEETLFQEIETLLAPPCAGHFSSIRGCCNFPFFVIYCFQTTKEDDYGIQSL